MKRQRGRPKTAQPVLLKNKKKKLIRLNKRLKSAKIVVKLGLNLKQ